MDESIVSPSICHTASKSAKLNLYVFNEKSRAAVYGIGTYIRELTGALSGGNVNICVVHLKADKPQIQFEEQDGIRHWYFPDAMHKQLTIDHKKKSELFYRNIAFLLRLHIEDKNNLIFHLNYNQSRKLAEELKKIFDCRIVTAIHYLDWCFSLSGNISRFRQILDNSEVNHGEFEKSIIRTYREEKEFLKNVDHVICLSENTRKIIQDFYNIRSDKISVLYNGLTDCTLIKDKPALRQKYSVPDIPVILFVGRLDNVKGLSYALRAFKTVVNTITSVHFIIVGNGAFSLYMKECEDIWRQITWTGLINKEKLYDLYSIADIGIMPSFHEQCSYVAIEMMMHGVPLIASTTTGLREMVEDGITGLHIPVEEHSDRVEIDTDHFAEKMIFMLKNTAEAKKMRENSRKRYLNEYSAEIFQKNIMRFYLSLFQTK